MNQKKDYSRMIWVSIFIALFVGVMALSLWYVPYEISHDQHMVDTVNVRALEYEHPEGVVTDFTEAEIMKQDAIEKYELMEWELDNPELYWYHAILRGVIFGGMAVLFSIWIIVMLDVMRLCMW